MIGLLQNLTASELALAAALLIFVYWSVSYIRFENKIRQLGGGRAPIIRSYLPFGIDFIYRSFQYAKHDENLALWHKLFKSGHASRPYTVETCMASERIIFTADSENIKAVLATQFHSYGKGESFNLLWKDFLGDSIFSTDHKMWHDARALVRAQFVKDRVSDLRTFEHHVQPLISLLGSGKGETIDAKDIFFRFTLDVATSFLFGESVNSLSQGGTQFAHAFAEIQRLQNSIMRAGPLHFLMPKKEFKRHIATLNAYVEPFVQQALAIPPSGLEAKSKSDSGNYTFLHAIAATSRDPQFLRDQLVAVLLAGRDTTACTLSWLFYELSSREDLVRRLRAEIETCIGFEKCPSYENLKTMKFLQYTINETLRLYSIVPYNVRVSLTDTTLPVGGGPDGLSPIAVPKGTNIAYSSQYLHLIEDNYPPVGPDFPDVAAFEPRRWMKWTPAPFSYIPFNAGPRICVGQQFALTEMQYTVVRVLQKFSKIESRQPPLSSTASDFAPGFCGTEGLKDESVPARFSRGRIQLQSEIVLSPKPPVLVAFFT